MAVDLDDCRINHGELHIGVVRSRVENAFENIGFNPVPVALEYRVPLAERWRQVPLGAASSRNPQNRLQEKPVVAAGPAWVRNLAQAKRRHLRPLGIRQN